MDKGGDFTPTSMLISYSRRACLFNAVFADRMARRLHVSTISPVTRDLIVCCAKSPVSIMQQSRYIVIFRIHSQRRLLASEAAPDNISPGSSNFTITDVSLRTIPQLRQFANDTLLDVLYFMSPEHHDIIIDIVVKEMNFVVEKFRTLTGFDGDISLVGHSLGSIITWDILDNQRNNASLMSTQPTMQPRVEEEEESPEVLGTSNNSETAPTGDECCTDPESSPEHEENHRTSSAYPQLSFNVDNAFMLGSPLAVFLMIRNQRKPLSADFTLSGCSRVFNIFHPYDPVAYRIEPLLDPRNADVEPTIMTHCEY
jgi:hypothetical protein